MAGFRNILVHESLEIARRRVYQALTWLVDPDLNAVAVYRRATDGAFPVAAALTAAAQDVLATPLVPGWSLTLARLFRYPPPSRPSWMPVGLFLIPTCPVGHRRLI